MRYIRATYEFLIRVSSVVGMFSIVAMMLHIATDVLFRSFGYPLIGTVTIVSHYYMVMCAFASLALAERENAHISVEVFTELLPMRSQYHLAHWLYPISFSVFGYLTYRSFVDALDKFDIGAFQIEADIAIQLWPSYAILPVGFGLMTLAVLFRFIDYMTGDAWEPFTRRSELPPLQE